MTQASSFLVFVYKDSSYLLIVFSLLIHVILVVDENSGVADPEFIDAPIFKQPGEPLHQSQPLRWNHKVRTCYTLPGLLPKKQRGDMNLVKHVFKSCEAQRERQIVHQTISACGNYCDAIKNLLFCRLM